MAFPATVLPLRVYIAPGAPAASQSDDGDWAWTEITDDVRVVDGVKIEAGRGDEAAAVDPGRCTLTLNNRDGHYSPRNVLGQWYGQIGRGTPLQVRVDLVADTFTRSSAEGWGTSDSGYAWSHPAPEWWAVNGSAGEAELTVADSAVYASLTGVGAPDADFTYSASLSAVTTGARWSSVALLRYSDTSNMLRVYTHFEPGGTIGVTLGQRKDATNEDFDSNTSTGVTYSAGAKVWTRCQVAGAQLRAKVWEDGDPEPDAWHVTWSTSDALPGTGFGIYQARYPGNTNAGSMTATIDDLAIQAILFTGSVPEWPVRWDKSGNDCWTPITATGILRRLLQGASALRSPLYRQLSSHSPTGYWPLEDASGSTSAASAVAGGLAARVSGVSFAADDTLDGAETAAHLESSSSRVEGIVRGRLSAASTTGYSFTWLMKLDALPGSETVFMTIYATGTVTRWVISGDSTSFVVRGYDAEGDVVAAPTSTTYVEDPTDWLALNLETTEDGVGNVDAVLHWGILGDDAYWFQDDSYAGTATNVTRFVAGGAAMSLGHVCVGENTIPFVSWEFSNASKGYDGETAVDRMVRLGDEESVPVMVEAGGSSTLGVQRIATFLELLRSAADADQGLLYEAGAGLAYRPRFARYNRGVDLALDFDEGHIAEPPEPTDDDQRLRNDWTISRDGGSSAHYEDADHIAIHGRYDEAATINVDSDDVLPYHAGWRVHLGTWDALRWPRIDLNLAAAPELIPLWLQCGVGSRVTIANPPDEVTGEQIDVLVEGYAMTLSAYDWEVTLNCSPARPWDTAVEGAAKATSGSSTTSGDFDAGTDTSLTVASTGEVWSTDSGEYPLDIRVSGVVLTVTAVSSSSSPQTFTVTQTPVNGITKTIPSGSAVVLADPPIVAL